MRIRSEGHDGGRLQLIGIHIDPMRTSQRLALTLQTLRELSDAFLPYNTVYGGDWNFVEADEGRLHTTAGTRYSPSSSSPVFHRILSGVVEHHQPLYTFRRTTGSATDATLSRTERLYSNLNEVSMQPVLSADFTCASRLATTCPSRSPSLLGALDRDYAVFLLLLRRTRYSSKFYRTSAPT